MFIWITFVLFFRGWGTHDWRVISALHDWNHYLMLRLPQNLGLSGRIKVEKSRCSLKSLYYIVISSHCSVKNAVGTARQSACLIESGLANISVGLIGQIRLHANTHFNQFAAHLFPL